jgi:hypothetical protein
MKLNKIWCKFIQFCSISYLFKNDAVTTFHNFLQPRNMTETCADTLVTDIGKKKFEPGWRYSCAGTPWLQPSTPGPSEAPTPSSTTSSSTLARLPWLPNVAGSPWTSAGCRCRPSLSGPVRTWPRWGNCRSWWRPLSGAASKATRKSGAEVPEFWPCGTLDSAIGKQRLGGNTYLI